MPAYITGVEQEYPVLLGTMADTTQLNCCCEEEAGRPMAPEGHMEQQPNLPQAQECGEQKWGINRVLGGAG